MVAQDTSKIKEKIVSIIRIGGPSFPTRIAKEINTSILFTSAFLSELVSEKRLKMSNLRFGSSPLYLMVGQEIMLENFLANLKNKEKDAWELLKEKKILNDSELEPSIRVALREIKDFAIPFKKDEQIYWKYLGVSENEKEIIMAPNLKDNFIELKEQTEKIDEEIKKEIIQEELIPTNQKRSKLIPKKMSGKNRKNSQKKDDGFFDKIKDFLSKKFIEIVNIEGASKNELFLRTKYLNEEKLLVAYNKKKINEKDIIKANKKANDLKLKYSILSFGEPAKKMNNFIDAVKNLENIEKI